jgi:hypothetical protein
VGDASAINFSYILLCSVSFLNTPYCAVVCRVQYSGLECMYLPAIETQ